MTRTAEFTMGNFKCMMKLTILLWKNGCVLLNNKFQLILSFITPIVLSLVLIIWKNNSNINIHDMKEIRPEIRFRYENLSEFWWNFTTENENKEEMLNILTPNFEYSVFVPREELAIATTDQNIIDYFDNIVPTVWKKDCQTLCQDMIRDHYFAGLCVEESGQRLRYDIVVPSELRNPVSYIGEGWLSEVNYQEGLYKSIVNHNYILLSPYTSEGLIFIQSAMIKANFPFLDWDLLDSLSISQIPQWPYNSDEFLLLNYRILALLLIICYILPTITVFQFIIEEKSSAVRTLLKRKGFGILMQNVAWLLTLWIITFFISNILIFLLGSQWTTKCSLFPHSSRIALFLVFFTYCFTNASFCLMLSGFLERQSYSRIFIGFFWLIFSLGSAYLPASETLDNDLSPLTYLCYNSFFIVYMNHIFMLEFHSKGLHFNSLNDSVEIKSLMVLFTIGVFFLLLSLLSDQFYPGKYGTRCKYLRLSFYKNKLKWLRANKIEKEKFESIVTDDGSGFPYPTLLTVRNVSKTWKDKKVINNLTFDLKRNQITAVVDSEGLCGWVLCRLVGGLLSPDSGSISYKGIDSQEDPELYTEEMGLCLGDATLLPDLTVYQQFRFHTFVNGLPSLAQTFEYIRALELDDYLELKTKHLTKKIKQKVSLICAMCENNNVLVLDRLVVESPDFEEQNLIKLLKDFKDTRTVLIATNSHYLAEQVADNVIVLDQGVVVFESSTQHQSVGVDEEFCLILYKNSSFDDVNYKDLLLFLQLYIPSLQCEASDVNLPYLRFDIKKKQVGQFAEILMELKQRLDVFNIASLTVQERGPLDIQLKIPEDFKTPQNCCLAADYMNHLPWLQGYKDFIRRTFASIARNEIEFFFLLIIPILFCLYMHYIARVAYLHTKPERVVFDLSIYKSHTVVTSSKVENRLYNSSRAILANTMWHYRQQIDEQSYRNIDHGTTDLIDFIYSSPELDLRKLTAGLAFGACRPDMRFSGNRKYFGCLQAFYSQWNPHSMPISYNMFVNAFLKASTNTSASVEVALQTLPYEHNANPSVLFSLSSLSFLIALSISLVNHLPDHLNKINQSGLQLSNLLIRPALTVVIYLVITIVLRAMNYQFIQITNNATFVLILILSSWQNAAFRILFHTIFGKEAFASAMVLVTTILSSMAYFAHSNSAMSQPDINYWLLTLPIYCSSKVLHLFFYQEAARNYCSNDHIYDMFVLADSPWLDLHACARTHY